MAEQEKEKKLDELLDSVFSQYSAVEPRPGLETRIMARIAESRSASSRNGALHWLWAGTAAAAIAAMVAVSFFSRPITRTQRISNTAQTHPQSVSPAPIARASRHRSPPRQIRVTRRTVRQLSAVKVRQEVFPTPVPLSKQEILLLRYLSRTPREELLAQSHPDPLPDDAANEEGSDLFPAVNYQRFSNQ